MYLGLTEGVALRCAHRLGRYVKHIRDLFIAHPLHIEFHHFLLPLGQSGIELGAAYNAGILAFAFDRTTHKLESCTIDLVKLSREIVELSREMYAKWEQSKSD